MSQLLTDWVNQDHQQHKRRKLVVLRSVAVDRVILLKVRLSIVSSFREVVADEEIEQG